MVEIIGALIRGNMVVDKFTHLKVMWQWFLLPSHSATLMGGEILGLFYTMPTMSTMVGVLVQVLSLNVHLY